MWVSGCPRWAQPFQLPHQCVGHLAAAAQGAQMQGDGGQLFQAFQPVVGLLHGVAPGHRPVVFQQQGAVLAAVGRHAVGDPLGPGQGEGGHRDGTQLDHGFLKHRPVQRETRRSKGRGGGRMGVDHRPDQGVLLIDPQVHLGLAGRLADPFQKVPVQVQLDQHLLGHGPFGHAGGGDPEGVFADADGQVAVVGGHQPPLVDLPARVQNGGLGLGVGGIGHRSALRPRPKALAKLSSKGG